MCSVRVCWRLLRDMVDEKLSALRHFVMEVGYV